MREKEIEEEENMKNYEKIDICKLSIFESDVIIADDVVVGDVANVADVAKVVQRQTLNKRLSTFRELAEKGKTLKPLKKIFGNYILEKSTTLFPSERGVGKSMLAMQLAIKIANGDREFLGEELELNGNVLYINLELGEHTICKRFEKMHENVELNNDFEAYCLSERRGLNEIMDEVKNFSIEKKPVLIIIDNLRTAFSGADNEKNKEMTSAITEINKFKDEIGSSILIVHHTKKGVNNQLTNSDMQSGAGSLTDLVDADFFLRKSGQGKDLRILKRVKARECEEQEGAKLVKLNSDNLWFEFVEEGVDESEHVLMEKSLEIREDKKQKCFELSKIGNSNAEISRILGVDRSTIGRWLSN